LIYRNFIISYHHAFPETGSVGEAPMHA